jgi:hypothetical protein
VGSADKNESSKCRLLNNKDSIFFAELGLELRAFTLSHSIKNPFVKGFVR